MADTKQYVAVKATRLSSGVSATATSIVVAAVEDRYGNTLTMTDFGDTAYAVFEPNTDREEHCLITGITGTTLTVTRGIDMKAPYAETAANKTAHSAGTTFIIYSNTPAMYDSFANKNNDETVTGVWTYTSTAKAKYDTHPTFSADTEIIDKKYADDLAIAGAPDSSETVKGLNEMATSVESVAGTDTGGTTGPLVVKPSDIGKNSQDSAHVFGIDAAGSDSYAITLTPAPTAYVAGQRFIFDALTANTGAATLNVNGLGAKTIKKFHDQDLETGDIEARSIIEVVYDGTNFQMQTPIAAALTTSIATETTNFFNATDITGAEAETLTNGSAADSLHSHAMKTGSGTIDSTNATDTIAHGLGTTPRLVRIHARAAATASTSVFSIGNFDSGSQGCIFWRDGGTTNGGVSPIQIMILQNGATIKQWTLSVDATNLTFTVDSPGAAFVPTIIFEVFA